MTSLLPERLSVAAPALPRLDPFPVPVHFKFMGRKGAWPDLFDGSPLPDPDTIPQRVIEVEECWIVQTYLRLRKAGLYATISDGFRAGAINVVSTHDLALRDLPAEFYIIATQQDGPRPAVRDRCVVQNELNVLSDTDHFIPHWPQPGLIPRDPRRGTRVQSLCFKGSEYNLYETFRSQAFISALRAESVELLYDVKEGDQGPSWHDYSASDLVFAVRDVTEADLKIKPASKLVNAWLAGCPALLGPEPAFQTLRRSELDYFEVRTPEEVLRAVRKLRENPQLYQAMSENGLRRGAEFAHPRITGHWYELLSGPAARDFVRMSERWQPAQRARRWGSFAIQALLHQVHRRVYLQARDHGYRPISNRWT